MKKTGKVSDRRTLRFGRMTDLTADIDQLIAAGEIEVTGNWTAAQIVAHVSGLIRMSIDGFGFKAPLLIRLAGPLMRSRVLNHPMSAGFKLKGAAAEAIVPSPSVTWDGAVADLRAQVERVERGAKMSHRSPVFGQLEHEEWAQLHCRHAEMHFSFMKSGATA